MKHYLYNFENMDFVLFHHNPRKAKDDISRQVCNDVILPLFNSRKLFCTWIIK